MAGSKGNREVGSWGNREVGRYRVDVKVIIMINSKFLCF